MDSTLRFRTDIQALRGVAVLLVVVYHSGLNVVGAGYLGVDLFFVISGFLITGIITRGLVEGRFCFAEFYARRVRRLLPAAYTVLLATSISAALLLTTTQYEAFLVNLFGAVFFSANITLWSQTGYFHPDAAFEPLLHMWSLAIEEQYYLLLPICLALLPRRAWLPVLAGATLLTLVGGVYLATIKPSVAFFWLPPRAWELGVGSVAALILEKDGVRHLARALLWPAILAIALVPIWPLPGPVPGIGALLVCLAAAIIILARDERADRSTPLRLLARVGDFSYSLYLVHWPLFALSRASRLTADLPPLVSVGLIAGSIGLAFLLYTFVEEPFRRSKVAIWKLVFIALAGSALVVAVAWALGTTKPGAVRRAGQEAPIEGLAVAGCFSEGNSAFDGRCSQSAAPEILLWGDSYSAHLVPGLDATSTRSFAQASRGHCSPLIGYAAVAAANEYATSKACLSFNDSVLDYVRRTPSLKVVILAGQYFRFLPEAAAFGIRSDGNGNVSRAPLGVGAVVQAQRDTVRRLRALGLRVIVVAPPLPSEFDMGKCWERTAEGLPVIGPHRGCILATDNRERRAQRFDEMVAGFETVANVPLIRLDRALCDARQCRIEQGGKPIFRDNGHFTRWGSLVVGGELQLGERAWTEAR